MDEKTFYPNNNKLELERNKKSAYRNENTRQVEFLPEKYPFVIALNFIAPGTHTR